MINTGQKFLSAPSALMTMTLRFHLWYDDTYWSKILHSTIPTTLSHVSHGQGSHILKFYIKVFRISLLLNCTMDLVPIWYHDMFISTISTHDLDLEVAVTDLEFKC